MYDLSTRLFQPLDLILPLKSTICALAINQELVLLTPNSTFKFNINTLQFKKEEILMNLDISHLIRPIVRNNDYFCATNRGIVWISHYPELNYKKQVGWVEKKVVKYTYDSEFNIIKSEKTIEN